MVFLDCLLHKDLWPELNDVQLTHFSLLDESDIDCINNRRGRANCLAVALLIGCVRFLGTWSHNLSSIPGKRSPYPYFTRWLTLPSFLMMK
ncbi:DUF4158 domain-containing protein [Salmonella enterica]|uniref:DUF4158 domain-containing protein n=1 Tax=Salmonella enterica TaxID=28901 RepID=UPI0024B39503|nr:DUF4158 domain-containing protein [Salmonella enterica]